MSVYLLASAHSADTCSEQVLPLYTQAGFALRERISLGPYALWLLDNPNVPALCTVRTQDGRFAAALGAFVYEGRSGRDALGGFLEDFPTKTEDLWSSTRGHFSIVIYQGGETSVMCDGLGAHKIYYLPDYTIASNAFLAPLAGCRRPTVDAHGAYVYAWNGAFFGGRTPVQQVRSLPANTILRIRERAEAVQKPSPILAALDTHEKPTDPVAHNLHTVMRCTSDISAAYTSDVALSFSGGYDSRLLLAALVAGGQRPSLFVYGTPGDTDVRIAEQVAEAEGLTFSHIDKRGEPPCGDAFADLVAQDLVVFDGWKNEGLIDIGTDHADRVARNTGGKVPFNGGLGEIYRNFYNLRDRDYTAEDVVACFYRQYRPSWATNAFDALDYTNTLADQMRAQLNTSQERLSPTQAQLLYALFRGRFWTAREAEINQRFGPMHFPFLEHDCITASIHVPMADRHFGRAQREMIRRAHERVASYPSSYGFAFSGRPSWRYRANVIASLARPVGMRPMLARARRGEPSRPLHLRADRLAQIIDPAFPSMSRFFQVHRIDDADTLNRVATLEYLCTRFGVM
ncbi:hypothetical protein CKO28_12975 [Rhodovibrio sodomensis]|uniref:Asparagine synthetase domain-containing protein n=1 Tax=Rhodovibrio sodomensis TaxID=1088 RepID=A0ABS1DGG5_9PROT|nr:hypothetical protein [Rhodovibrio sodomensis]MBK1668944.1 hypothetical protein [Rhodovibrio sodomensis]